MKKINKSGYAILKERMEEVELYLRVTKKKLQVADNKLKATKDQCAKYEALYNEQKSRTEMLATRYEGIINEMYEHMGIFRRWLWDMEHAND